VIVRDPHVPEERLVDSYFADRRGEHLDPPVAEHLAGCERCRQRYAELTRVMSSLRTQLEAEIDALFPAERLRSQRQEIRRRLEHLGRAARVISFPGRSAGPPARTSPQRFAVRWVAAAAAAGLFLGIAAGRVLDRDSSSPPRPRQATATPQPAPVRSAPTRAELATSIVDADEYFMSDLERALDRPRTRELLAFDALTPRVREVRVVR
jgi:anti-sigma factor RsiW